jgi:hypothetical protein
VVETILFCHLVVSHADISLHRYRIAYPIHQLHTMTSAPQDSASSKPTILHLGDDIRWNHDLYAELQSKFNIIRTYSMGREEFKTALKEKTWGDFVGMYRPFWNTGGEMGNWDEECTPHISLSHNHT